MAPQSAVLGLDVFYREVLMVFVGKVDYSGLIYAKHIRNMIKGSGNKFWMKNVWVGVFWAYINKTYLCDVPKISHK